MQGALEGCARLAERLSVAARDRHCMWKKRPQRPIEHLTINAQLPAAFAGKAWNGCTIEAVHMSE